MIKKKEVEKRKDKLRFNILCGVVLIILVLSLIPLLKSGYYGDDAINCLTPGFVAMDWGGSVNTMTRNFVNSWLIKEGRLYPLSSYGYLMFNVIQSRLGYKIFLLTMILINCVLFGYLLFLQTKDKYLSLLVLMLLPLFFQIRIFHDPITSFSGIMQFILSYLLVSLIFLKKSLTNKSNWYLFGSIIFYICAMLTYEIAYLFFLFHILMIYENKKSITETLKTALPFVIVFLLLVVTSLVLRARALNIDNAYRVNPDILAYLSAYGNQLLASFPLNYFFFDPQHLFTFDLFRSFSRITIVEAFIAAFSVVLFRVAVPRLSKKIQYNFLFVFGLSLVLIPGMLIALSPRYQTIVTLGYGYLPVYLQYFGAVLLFVSGIGILVSRYNRYLNLKIMKLIASVIIVTVIVVNYQSNNTAVELQNYGMLYPRENLEKFVKTELFSSIPEGSIVLQRSQTHWDNKQFFYMINKKTYEVMNEKEYIKQAATIKNDSVYLVTYKPDTVKDFTYKLEKLNMKTGNYIEMGTCKIKWKDD